MRTLPTRFTAIRLSLLAARGSMARLVGIHLLPSGGWYARYLTPGPSLVSVLSEVATERAWNAPVAS